MKRKDPSLAVGFIYSKPVTAEHAMFVIASPSPISPKYTSRDSRNAFRKYSIASIVSFLRGCPNE